MPPVSTVPPVSTKQMTELPLDVVRKVARLARLKLSEEEISRMRQQLNETLTYVELLNEVDTADVEPMAHAVEMTNVFRADEPQPSLTRAQALSNAPKSDGRYFLVPAILDEG